MIKKFVLFSFIFLHSLEIRAQLNVALNQLFKPNVRLRYQILPTQSWHDSVRLGYRQATLAGIIPLGGKADVKLKELKIQAHQTFLNVAIGGRQVEMTNLKENARLGNFSLGVTHVRGRVGKGVWLYSAQVGGIANQAIQEKRNFFGLGAIAKIQIKGLRKQNIYGVAIVIAQNNIIPVPIAGWNRKLGKRWDMALLLPIQANISYKAGKKTTLEWQNGFSAFAFPTEATQIQYFDVRSSLELTQKLHKNWQIIAEAGIIPFRRLKNIQTYQGVASSGFATLGIRFSLPQGWISSQMFEAE